MASAAFICDGTCSGIFIPVPYGLTVNEYRHSSTSASVRRKVAWQLPVANVRPAIREAGSVFRDSKGVKNFAQTNKSTFLSDARPAGGRSSTICKAGSNERIATARKVQLQASQLLAELLKAEGNVAAKAAEHANSLTEDFFIVTSTYMEMAKKEGNEEVVKQLRVVLETALKEKEKTLRPEIRLLNQLLRDKNPSERMITMGASTGLLRNDSYFFVLLNRMLLDVERQPATAEQSKLLIQLKSILREAKETAKGLSPSTSPPSSQGDSPKPKGFGT